VSTQLLELLLQAQGIAIPQDLLGATVHQIAGNQIHRAEDPVAKDRRGHQYLESLIRLVAHKTGA